MSQGDDPIEDLRPLAMTAAMMATRAAEALTKGAQTRKEQELAQRVEETRRLEQRHQAHVAVDRLGEERGSGVTTGEYGIADRDAAVLDQAAEADRLRETERDLDGQAQPADDPEQTNIVSAEARDAGDRAAGLEVSADVHTDAAVAGELDYDSDERRAAADEQMATHNVPAEQAHAHQVADRLNGIDPKTGPQLSRRKTRGRPGSGTLAVGKDRDRTRSR